MFKIYALQTTLTMDANTMTPDQEQSDLGPYCLQYTKASKVHMQTWEQTTIEKGDNTYRIPWGRWYIHVTINQLIQLILQFTHFVS